MLRVWKDENQTNEVQATQLLSLTQSVGDSSGTKYNLALGSGATVYQIYKYTENGLGKLPAAEFSILGDQLTLVVGLLPDELLIVIPSSRVDMLFGGEPGDTVSMDSRLFLRRDSGFMYANVKVYSQDLITGVAPVIQAGVTFVEGVSNEAFSGLIPGSLVGMAVCSDIGYIGKVQANTATSILLDDATYSNPVAVKLELFSVSHLLFAVDNEGVPGEYKPVLFFSDILDDTSVPFWVRDTYVIPNAAINHPNNTIRVRSIEHLA